MEIYPGLPETAHEKSPHGTQGNGNHFPGQRLPKFLGEYTRGTPSPALFRFDMQDRLNRGLALMPVDRPTGNNFQPE